MTGAVRYEMMVWWDPLPDWQSLGGDNLTATSFTHTGLTAGTEYFYTIRAVDAEGQKSDWQQDYAAATVSANTPTPTPTLTPTPTPTDLSPEIAAAQQEPTPTPTLTLVGHTGPWWYGAATRQGGPPRDCHEVAPGVYSVRLTGLVTGRSNYYSAHSAAGCTSASRIARNAFNTFDLTASNIGVNTATLATPGYAGEWWYKGSHSGACTAVAANTASVSLSGLSGGTAYTYKAYINATCTVERGTVRFTTQ